MNQKRTAKPTNESSKLQPVYLPHTKYESQTMNFCKQSFKGTTSPDKNFQHFKYFWH